MKMKVLKLVKVTVVSLLLTATTFTNIGGKAAKVTTSEIRQGPFLIGVIDDNEDTSIGKEIDKALKKSSKSYNKLDKKINEIPDEVEAIWVSEDLLDEPNIENIFKKSKQKKKPFYIYGDKLNPQAISNQFDLNYGIFPEIESDKYSVDMMGFKFEDGETKPSFVISYNRGNNEYELKDLEELTRRYDIKLKQERHSISSMFTPNVAQAAGMTIELPDTYSKIYTWEASCFNWVEYDVGKYQRGATYHVWEVYKDDTPSNPDYKSYVYFRADEPIDTIDRFRSKDQVLRLDSENSNIITKSWLPDNSALSGSVSLSLSYPPSASVDFDTSGDIEIFDAEGSLDTDYHYFAVEDNEYLDTLLRPGDVWVSSQSYDITQSATGHKIGSRFAVKVRGVDEAADYDEWSDYDVTGASSFVYWVVRR